MKPRFLRAAMALAAILAASAADSPAPKGLNIYFIDVQGGAATLLVTPERESILIDSGWPGLEDRDPKRIVHVLKDVAGLDHLDHLVTTHWHMDHFGGVAGLSKMIRIDHFWDRGYPDPTKPDNDLANFPDGPKPNDPLGIAYLEASKGKRKVLLAGDSLPLKGGIKALVLASGGRIIKEETRFPKQSVKINPLCEMAPGDQEPDHSDNARSLVIRFSLGNFDFLDAGDLTWNMEKALVCPKDLIGQIDLYQVTHHGMGISNHPTLVKTIQPIVAVMDNGPKKGGSPSTVNLLRDTPSVQASYQLHRNVDTPPQENVPAEWIANQNPAGGQFIQVNIAPDGSKFSARIGTDGAVKDFVSK